MQNDEKLHSIFVEITIELYRTTVYIIAVILNTK